MKNKKRSSLQKNLFKKYVISFLVFEITFQILLGYTMSFMTRFSGELFFSTDDTFHQVEKNGLNAFLKNTKIPKASYIELLDTNYVIKESINSTHSEGFKYSKKAINDIINKKAKKTNIYFLMNSQEFIIIHENTSVDLYSLLFLILVFMLLAFIILPYIFFFKIMAKYVSKTLGKPLNILIQGVNAFKNKEYSHRIEFTSNNELDDLKDSFNNMAAALEEEINLKVQAQNLTKQLILDVTHDLKTPLTNIEGYAEILSENNDLDDNKKNQYLSIILSNSKRTNALIRDLFDFVYSDYANSNLKKTSVNFCEMLRRLLAEYIPIFEDSNRLYKFQIPEYDIQCSIDKKLIERAICNIINNFLKYSGDNTTITFNLSENNSNVILIIENDGKGIEKDKCESIFLPFVREDDSRNSKTGGTGLGLSITKKIIENHGGTIFLESDVGKGVKFIIILPK